MNTKTLIGSLALVLGIAAPAMAAPQHREVDLRRGDRVTVVDRSFHRNHHPVIVREAPRPVIVRAPVIQRSYWVQLASSFQLNSDGRMSLSQFAPMNAREITIAANGCATKIDEVAILYTDGTGQVERDLNFRVDGQRPLTLGANPYKQIQRVVVYGPSGSYDQSLTLSALI